jgi:flavorubredoxin
VSFLNYLKLKDDIYWVGALDPNLRIFDIVMYTPYGTTYNSYVVKGSEKVALFETVKEQFFPEYIDRLKNLGIDINNIDYIILDHTEPDHAGSISKLLDLSNNATVVGSQIAISYLEQIANREFKSIIVKDGDSISLGNKTLKFISAPLLHWPDSIYTYVEEDNILFTCDSFGSHYCTNKIFNDLNENDEQYLEALKHYFDCIMRPFKPFVLKAIDKIESLNIDMICPGHGPILRDNPWKIVELYKSWSTPQEKTSNKKKITVFYVSAYGYTEILCNKIIEGLNSVGDFEIKSYDVIKNNIVDIINDIDDSDAILVGSPTINSDLLEPVRDVLTRLNPIIHKGKFAAAFGSYGWSGEAVPQIETRFSELRMKIALPGLKVRFNPSEDELLKAFTFGNDFAKKLL